MTALVEANRCRVAKKEIRLAVKAGRRVASEIIATYPKEVRSAKLSDVIAWTPAIGRTKAANLCRSLRINPNRRLDALHPLERRRVTTRMAEYEAGRRERGNGNEQRITSAA